MSHSYDSSATIDQYSVQLLEPNKVFNNWLFQCSIGFKNWPKIFKNLNIDRTLTLTHSAPSFSVLTLFLKKNLSTSWRSMGQSKGLVNVYYFYGNSAASISFMDFGDEIMETIRRYSDSSPISLRCQQHLKMVTVKLVILW